MSNLLNTNSNTNNIQISTKEWNAYIDSIKNALAEGKNWQNELEECLELEKAAKTGEETALLEYAAFKANNGIDYEESVAFLTKKAEEGNAYALKTLGFLHCVGVFNAFDNSKNSLIDINSEENEKKAEEYFKKAAEKGSVHAKVWFAIRDCIKVASEAEESDSSEENTEAPTADDFYKAEKEALEAIEESKKGNCDCTPDAIKFVCSWLSKLYASDNPVNPIHNEEKAKYWNEESERP